MRRGLCSSAVLVVVLSGCVRRPAESTAHVSPVPRAGSDIHGLTIDYPAEGTLFPPDVAPPTFRWTDDQTGNNAWRIGIEFADGGDPLCVMASAREWSPSMAEWEEIKRRSCERDATVTIAELKRTASAQVTIRTSRDEVGAPLFYREVNLPFAEAVKDPSKIRWRFGPVSALEPPPIVLEGLPVCGNCHSFSADGALLGMDVDYANDKGSYALAPLQPDMTLATSDIITWADYRREDGQATFGLLSQVSPDGRYAISTVKDRSVFVAKPELSFSQLFFPIRGILAVYERQTRSFRSLPGADDPAYVQSNPTWSPDGKYVVLARSRAHHLKSDSGNVLLTPEECAEFLEDGRPFLFDLYRVPFNGGAGGPAEPLPGASHNGKSNFFAKYSPDGKWIVFCQARSYMLLQPDSELYIIPAAGGAARRLECNTGRMNSWHSWSPNGKWLVFSSKANSDFTQLFLTHIDESGHSSPPVVLSRLTAPDRAANIPEFVNAAPDAIARIRPEFVDDVSYVRAGDAFLRANDVTGATQQFRKALELNPRNSDAHSNLGGVLVNQGLVADGVMHLEEAIRLDPTSGGAYYNLGMLRSRQGRVDEAIRQLTLAVRYRPEVADAHRVLGALLCSQGAHSAGLDQLQEAARLDPNDASTRYCLGKALAEVNRPNDAVPHLHAAVQLDPNDPAAPHLLGQLLFQQGRIAPAIEHLSRAAQLSPDDPGILGDLALSLAVSQDAGSRDPERAIVRAQRACELTHHEAAAPLDLLGLCYAAAGRFPEAIEAAEQALRLARRAGQDQTAAGIAERIALYRAGKMYKPPAADERLK